MKTCAWYPLRWLTILWIVSFSMSSGQLCAQVQYSNRLLLDISGQLAAYCNIEGVLSEITIPELCKSKPIVVERTSPNIITHIGVKLFDREMISKYPSPLYLFIERYLLELLLLPTNQDVITKMKMERVKIDSEVYSMEKINDGIQNISSAFSSNLSFTILCRNNRYVFSCINRSQKILEMSFPVRHELISGYTKLEAENSFYTDLLMYRDMDNLPLDEAELFVYKDTLYSFNEDNYLTEEFISTSYYQKENNRIKPILSSEILMESVYNLFNSGYDWEVEANVSQSMYGGKSRSYSVPLSKLLHFIRKQNCQVYTSIQKLDKSDVEGGIMAVNMELGYQHLLMYSFSKDLIKYPQERRVKIKMYAYIPIHNVSSLFENKKSKIK